MVTEDGLLLVCWVSDPLEGTTCSQGCPKEAGVLLPQGARKIKGECMMKQRVNSL